MDRPVGSLKVNSSGFANYQYPIAVPPGIGHGNEPSLSVNYSHGYLTNGVLGTGWSLSGLSSITLTPPTLAVDCPPAPNTPPVVDLTVTFRYALNGAELLCTSGQYAQPSSIYRTELDDGSGQIVTLSQDVSSFVVTDSFGQRHEYGTTSDSRISISPTGQSAGGNTTIVEWKLKRSYDPFGNYIEYNYMTNPTSSQSPDEAGNLYITSIRYTSNDSYRTESQTGYVGRMGVNFSYIARSDVMKTTVWGRLTSSSCILDTIKTSVDLADGTVLTPRSYKFSYIQSKATGDSLLTSIVEQSSSVNGLNPTIFKYSGSDFSTWQPFSQSRSDIVSLDQTSSSLTIAPVDMTGRSYADLVCVQSNTTNPVAITPFLATPSVGAADSKVTMQWAPLDNDRSNTAFPDIANAQATSFLTADLNRDGRVDMVVPYSANGTLSFGVTGSLGSGYGPPTTLPTSFDWIDKCKYFAIDVDGNGMTDVVRIQSDDQQGSHQIWTFYDIHSATSNNPPFTTSTPQWTDPDWTDSSKIIDWVPIQLQKGNGSGLVRISDIPDSNTVGQNKIVAKVFSSTQSPFSRAAFDLVSSIDLFEYETGARPQISVLTADINGDGSDDIVVCTCLVSQNLGEWQATMTFQSFLFDGSSTFQCQNLIAHDPVTISSQPSGPTSGSFYVMSLDGSRYPCIVYTYEEETGDWSALIGRGSSNGNVSVLNKVSIATAANSSMSNPWELTPADVNGVGRGGFIMSTVLPNPADGTDYHICPVYNTLEISDRLTATTNPVGLRHEITYSPMSLPSFYSTDVSWDGYEAPPNNGDVPTFGTSTYLVSQIRKINDPGTNALIIGDPVSKAGRTKTYTYKGGKMSRTGRGWLGFGSMTEFDVDNGVQYNSQYSQTWPLAGRLLQKDTHGSTHSALLSRLGKRPPQYGNDPNELQLLQTLTLAYHTVTTSNPNNVSTYLSTLWQEETIMKDEDGTQQTFGTKYEYFPNSNQRSLEHTYQLTNSQTVTELWKRTSLAPVINGIAFSPGARKVTTSTSNLNFESFEDGDLSLSTFQYDQSRGNLYQSSDWVSDTKSFSTRSRHVDTFGNEILVVDAANLTTTTTFDPIFHTFPVKTTYTADLVDVFHPKIKQTIYSAFNPGDGTQFMACSAAGSIIVTVRDEWGRQLERWEVASDPSQGTSASTSFSLPIGLSWDPGFQVLLPQVNYYKCEQVVYSDVNQQTPYLFRSRTLFNDVNTTTAGAGQEYIDCEGNLRLQRCQDGGLKPVTWQYREYDSHGSMILESYPTMTNGALTWVPDYQSCRVLVCDALKRPVITVTPPDVANSRFTSLEMVHTGGGTVRTSHLRQSNNFQFGASDSVIETMFHNFVKYDKNLRVQKQQNTSDVSQTCTFDELGNMLTIVDAALKTEKRTYNSLGKIATINNTNQNPLGDPNLVLTRTYDSLGRLVTETNAAKEVTNFEYDAKGRLTVKKDFDKRWTIYSYDTSPSTMDLLASASIIANATQSGTGTTEVKYDYEYDKRGLLSAETLSFGGTDSYTCQYCYDRQGHLTQKIFPDLSTLNYTWKAEYLSTVEMKGRTGEIWDLTASYQKYNEAGLPLDWSLNGTGATATSYAGSTAYDTKSRPVELDFKNGSGTSIVDIVLKYDAMDQIVSSQQAGIGETIYHYTNKRLMSSTSPNGSGSYQYDDSGNLTVKNDMTFTLTTLTNNGDNFGLQLQGDGAGNSSYTCFYDNAGRATLRQGPSGDWITMTYDGYGKVRTFATSGQTLSTMYTDHKGRTAQSINAAGIRQVNFGKDYTVTIQTDGSKTIQKKMFGISSLLASVTSKLPPQSSTPTSIQLDVYVTNQKGTVTNVLDGAGTINRRFNYDDWGLLQSITVSGSSVQPTETDMYVTYEANPQDQFSGLLDFGGRWYDPVFCRFTTPDLDFSQKHLLRPDGTNLYTFESNNPINYVDPSGHINWSFIAAVAIGVAMVAGAIAISVLTDGVGTPLVAMAWSAAQGALMGGGIAGLSFAWKNRNMSDTKTFWKGFGVDVAIGAAVGAVTGAGGRWMAGVKSSATVLDSFSSLLDAQGDVAGAATKFTGRWFLSLGGRALLDGAAGAGQKAADVEAENAVMHTHQTFTWQSLLETGVESGATTLAFGGLEAAGEVPGIKAFRQDATMSVKKTLARIHPKLGGDLRLPSEIFQGKIDKMWKIPRYGTFGGGFRLSLTQP